VARARRSDVYQVYWSIAGRAPRITELCGAYGAPRPGGGK